MKTKIRFRSVISKIELTGTENIGIGEKKKKPFKIMDICWTHTKQKKVYEPACAEASAGRKAIKNWPKDDRPREKLFKEGEHKLSNTELLAILLRSGVKGQSAIDLARKIIQRFKTFRNMSHTDIRDWEEFKGLGQAKIAQIKAAIEIGRWFRELFGVERACCREVKGSCYKEGYSGKGFL